MGNYVDLEEHYALGVRLNESLARIASLEAQLEKTRGIIEVVVEVKDDDCYYDHHGYCQAHNLEEDCHVARAKKWLEENN